MILSFDVNQQTVSRSGVTSIPRKGSREYLYLSFTFSDDWTGLTKTLYVSNETYSDGIIVEKGIPVQVPIYYTQQNSFSITLCGIRGNQFVPTNVITILLEESNDTWEEIAPDPESIPYQQLIAMVQKAIEAMHAPYINEETNTWMQWSIEQNMFVDTGIVAESATYAAQAQQAAVGSTAAKNAAEQAKTAAQTAATAAESAAAYVEGVFNLYGVRFSGTSNSGTRLYSAQGLVANVLTDGESPGSFEPPVNSFDNIYPWSARRRCCGYWNEQNEFVINAYEGEPGYTTDGSNGEVWIEHSLFYFKHTIEDSFEDFVISGTPLAGFRPAPIFDRGSQPPLQKAYTAAYPLAFVDGVPTSRAGVFSEYKSLNDFMTSLKAVNENYRTGTAAEQYTEMLYMYVEFATRNLQAVMQGAVNLPYDASHKIKSIGIVGNEYTLITVSGISKSTFVVGQTIGVGKSLGDNKYDQNLQIAEIRDSGTTLVIAGTGHTVPTGSIVYSLPYKNGVCDDLLGFASSGTYTNDGKHQCFYRGKESPWGNAFEWLSDVLCSNDGFKMYYLPDTRKYSAGAITSDYIELRGTIPDADGYIKSFQVDERYPHIIYPKEIRASSTTGYADCFYYPRYAVCGACVGGSWINGTLSGPTSWLCHYVPAYAGLSSRARLSFRKP